MVLAVTNISLSLMEANESIVRTLTQTLSGLDDSSAVVSVEERPATVANKLINEHVAIADIFI